MRASIFKQTSILAGGHVAGQACALIRNIVIARVIGPENFGLAATFVVTVSLLEMLSDLSLDKLILQAKDGNDTRLQACAQFLQVLRGAGMAVLLFLLAGPIAELFDAPQAAWAYQMLALLPLIRGFAHLDVKRFQRELRFSPFVFVELVPQIAGLGAAIVLSLWIRDYSVALWIILIQAVVMVALSHVWATRAYRWVIDREAMGRFFRFGWPLVLNGLLLWIATQSDRAVVGSMLSSEDLGVYSATLSLLIIPAMLLQRVFGQMGLPALASHQDAPVDFSRRYRKITEVYVASVLIIFVALSFATATLVELMYGERYEMASLAVSFLVIAAALRCIRGVPTLAALSLAKTRTVMMGNLVRALGLPAVILAAMYWGSLASVAGMLCLTEAISLLTVSILVRKSLVRAHCQPPRRTPFLLTVVCVSASAMFAVWFPVHDPVYALSISAILFLVTCAGAVVFLPEVRAVTRDIGAVVFK